MWWLARCPARNTMENGSLNHSYTGFADSNIRIRHSQSSVPSAGPMTSVHRLADGLSFEFAPRVSPSSPQILNLGFSNVHELSRGGGGGRCGGVECMWLSLDECPRRRVEESLASGRSRSPRSFNVGAHLHNAWAVGDAILDAAGQKRSLICGIVCW